jgi:hypothetical protein
MPTAIAGLLKLALTDGPRQRTIPSATQGMNGLLADIAESTRTRSLRSYNISTRTWCMTVNNRTVDEFPSQYSDDSPDD